MTVNTKKKVSSYKKCDRRGGSRNAKNSMTYYLNAALCDLFLLVITMLKLAISVRTSRDARKSNKLRLKVKLVN